MNIAQHGYLVLFLMVTPLWLFSIGFLLTGIGFCYYFIMKGYVAKESLDMETIGK